MKPQIWDAKNLKGYTSATLGKSS